VRLTGKKYVRKNGLELKIKSIIKRLHQPRNSEQFMYAVELMKGINRKVPHQNKGIEIARKFTVY
jgi:hypothetical protein